MRLSLSLQVTVAAAFLITVGCADTSEIDAQPAAEVKPAAPAALAPPAAPAAPAAVDGDSWTLAADSSSIGFLGAKVTNTHAGGFGAIAGSAVTKDGAPVSARFDVTMATLWADTATPEPGSGPFKLTSHLKSPDFFNVDQHPTATFTSTAIAAAEGDNAYTVTGTLEILGKANEVTFPATIVVGDTVKADAKFSINRQDWGITYPGKPDDLIKDEVALTIDLTLNK